MPIKSHKFAVGAALAALMIGSTAACGSDDDGDGPSAASPSGPTASVSGSTQAPIKLMAIVGLTGPVVFPEIVTSMKAAAKNVNDSGGVNGRQIEILVCDEKNDVNVAAACARKAIEEKATAVVGGTAATGGIIMPVLEKAGIPDVASQPVSPAQTNSPLSFPITSLALGFTAQAAVLKAAGATSVEFAGPNNPAYLGLVELTKSLLPQVGIKFQGNVNFARDATEFTQTAAQIYNSGADGYAPFVTNTVALPAFVKAVNDAGEKFGEDPTVINGAIFTPSVLDDELKGKLEGLYVLHSGQTPTDTALPGIKAYHDQVAALGGEKIEYTDTGLQSFVGVHVIADLLKKATGDVAAPAVLVDAMRKAGPINYPGWTPFDWSKPALPGPLAKIFPRYFNTTFYVSQVKDNKLVTVVDAPVQFTGPITLKK